MPNKKWTKKQQRAHRKLWIKALRSGKYKQTSYTLRTVEPEAFCCLGVACDLYLKSGDAPKVAKWRDDTFQFKSRPKKPADEIKFSDYLHDGNLPEVVQDWLGLDNEEGRYYSSGGETRLTTHNDRDAMNFEQIANIIESEPKGLIAE